MRPAAPERTEGGIRVLLVEDDTFIRIMLEDTLVGLGHEIVAEAYKLHRALELAKSAEYELAILDVNLHGATAFPAAEIGDTFTVTAGCDKSLATCRDRFNNVANLRGFPFIPGNDAVTGYANTGDKNDGTSRIGS